MPPGDMPVGNRNLEEENSTLKNESEEMDVDKEYLPSFSQSDWFVERILNYNDLNSNIEKVYEAVKYWKNIADNLRKVDYPIVEGIDNTKQFDESLRQQAIMLDDFLNILITKNSNNDANVFKILEILLAQGDDYQYFQTKMNNLDFSLKCNEIWDNNAVAYRCNTCALTPCMSLCESCFEENGHHGHDFTRFFSREGGACDCGNDDVIKSQGFCKRHGSHVFKPPTNFLDVSLPEFIVTKVIVRLFLLWRGWNSRKIKKENSMEWAHSEIYFLISFCDNEVEKGRKYVEFLKKCADYGGPMREMIARLLLDKEMYKALTEKTIDHVNANNRVEVSLDWRSRALFQEDKKSLCLPKDIEQSFPLANSLESLDCECLLDELIFWIIRQSFPQQLINFSLSMLSEVKYRDHFAIKFFTWYPMTANLISDYCFNQMLQNRNKEVVQTICSRIIHVSVQMLSSATLCKKLNKEVDLVNTVCNVTQFLLCDQTKWSEITLVSEYRKVMSSSILSQYIPTCWKVLKMENNSCIHQHGYWFVMGDMQNLLSHTPLAIATVLDQNTFKNYIAMLSKMQGMNLIWRIVTGDHRETDTAEAVQKAYTLEFETLAVTLFNLVSAIQAEKHLNAAVALFENILSALKNWVEFMLLRNDNYDNKKKKKEATCQAYAVSFHIPLHRHLSTALTHFHEIEGFQKKVEEILTNDEESLRVFMLNPLRIQSAREEINCGMWVRNGSEAKLLSVIYSQWNVNNAFQMPDIDLIRFCGANINKEMFGKTLSSMFYLDEQLNYKANEKVHKRLRSRIFKIKEDESRSEENCSNENLEKYEKYLNNEELIEMVVRNKGKAEASAEIRKLIDEFASKICVFFKEPNPQFFADEFDAIRVFLNEPPQADGERIFERISKIKRHNQENTARILEIPILLRKEWLNSMYCGFFKLIAQLVVIRINCGATTEEHYRSEMVNCLATFNMTHSRLRGCIPEKGSRGSEKIDKTFDKVLSEIAVFIDPDEMLSETNMQQGTYRLKAEVWKEEICPIFAMMRANTQRHEAEIFNKLAQFDRDQLKLTKEFEGIQNDSSLWISFLLIDFDKKLRHTGISNIYWFLVTETMLLTCIAALELAESKESHFHETTIQLAVYLLTLSVKFAQTYEGDEEVKKYLRLVYHKPFKMELTDGEYKTHTIFSYMYQRFLVEANSAGNYLKFLEKTINGDFDKRKVIGGAAVYYGRFMAILAKLSPTCMNLLKTELAEGNSIAENMLNVSNKSRIDEKKEEEKKAAKIRMEKIMAKRKEKNKLTMEKLMKKEGISKEEIDDMNTSEINVQLYECPICGDSDMPNTLSKPFGLLINIISNCVVQEQIDGRYDVPMNLLGHDKMQQNQEKMKHLRRRTYFLKKMKTLNNFASYAKFANVLCGTELKNCGHYAHVECFNAYKQSLYDNRGRPNQLETTCPICRYSVNAILPLTIDFGYETSNKGPFRNDDEVFDAFRKCAEASGKNFLSPSDLVAYEDHYSTKSEKKGALEKMVWLEESFRSGTNYRTICSGIVSVASTAVERSLILRKLNLPERRKNTRKITTKHLLSAIVATTTQEDGEFVLGTIGQLLLCKKEMKRNVELERRDEEYQRAHNEEKRRRLEKTREDYCCALSLEDLEALDSTLPKEFKKFSPGEMNTFKTMENIYPIILCDPKQLLCRAISYFFDNQEYSKEDQKVLCHLISIRFLQMVTVRAVCRLLFSLKKEQFEAIRKNEKDFSRLIEPLRELPNQVATILAESTALFEIIKELQEDEATERPEINDDLFVRSIHEHIIDYAQFIMELFYHLDLVQLADLEMIIQPNADFNTVAEVLKIEKTELKPQTQKHEQWILNHLHKTIMTFIQSGGNMYIAEEPLIWKTRTLLSLPEKYDVIFSRYFHRECETCLKAPINTMVCLLCAKIVCLDDCCKIVVESNEIHFRTEVEEHANECSSSSGVFLSLNSSLIIVTRNRQAAIWGSVYLDSHGEEDRNLKRGKPLRLSIRRYECLQRDYIDQEYQRVRLWIDLGSLPRALREAHTAFSPF